MKRYKVFVPSLLRAFGFLWLLVEIINFFLGDEVVNKIRSFWWVFLIISIGYGTFKSWPIKRFTYHVNERDITVELVIGDIFRENGPIIVGSNTMFLTDDKIISPKSIQGQFANRYCANDSINSQVKLQQPNLPVDFGTSVTIKEKDRIGYFCAIAELNASGVAQSNLENLQRSFAVLWEYLSNSAEKSILNVPILGTGFSRVPESREVVIREMILSFLAAINHSSFCEGIRIVIHPRDIKKNKIDICKLVRFLEHHCYYVQRNSNVDKIGREQD